MSSFQQSSIFTSPNDPEDDLYTGYIVANSSGLGASQNIQILAGNAAAGLVAGQVSALEFQVAVPAPKIYFQLLNATDKLLIQTPTGLIENLDTTGGVANGFNYQPSYGATYILYFTAGAIYAAGTPLINMQAVLENTIGQYIDIPSIMWQDDNGKPLMGPDRPMVRQGVSGNTVSAVPNTIYVDFVNYKVKRGQNFVVTFRVLVNAAAVETFGGFGGPSSAGANTRSVQLIAGQNYTAIWNATLSGMITGTYSLLVSSAGTLSLPATVPVISIPEQREEYNESIMGQAVDIGSNVSQLPAYSLDSVRTMMPNNDRLEQMVLRLAEDNNEAHSHFRRVIDDLCRMVKRLEHDDVEQRRDLTEMSREMRGSKMIHDEDKF